MTSITALPADKLRDIIRNIYTIIVRRIQLKPAIRSLLLLRFIHTELKSILLSFGLNKYLVLSIMMIAL